MTESALAVMEDFIVRLAGRESTDVVPVVGGCAVLNARFPLSHVHNQLLLTEAVSLDVAVAEADRVLGARGLAHRRIVWIGPVPAHYREELQHVGWSVGENVLMHWDGHHHPSNGIEVRTVPAAAVRAAVEKSWIDDGESPATAGQLADRTAATDAACSLTTHAVYDEVDGGDDVVAWCELRQLRVGGVHVGQIEGVYTREDRRRKGYGRAVTVDALARARADGCELIFLEADAHDWPRHLYAGLGFHAHGTTMNAHRTVATTA
jgi:ribosomal protein S18 acetylase RimI-like enzyme